MVDSWSAGSRGRQPWSSGPLERRFLGLRCLELFLEGRIGHYVGVDRQPPRRRWRNLFRLRGARWSPPRPPLRSSSQRPSWAFACAEFCELPALAGVSSRRFLAVRLTVDFVAAFPVAGPSSVSVECSLTGSGSSRAPWMEGASGPEEGGPAGRLAALRRRRAGCALVVVRSSLVLMWARGGRASNSSMARTRTFSRCAGGAGLRKLAEPMW